MRDPSSERNARVSGAEILVALDDRPRAARIQQPIDLRRLRRVDGTSDTASAVRAGETALMGVPEAAS
jgi:hypothetical protein